MLHHSSQGCRSTAFSCWLAGYYLPDRCTNSGTVARGASRVTGVVTGGAFGGTRISREAVNHDENPFDHHLLESVPVICSFSKNLDNSSVTFLATIANKYSCCSFKYQNFNRSFGQQWQDISALRVQMQCDLFKVSIVFTPYLPQKIIHHTKLLLFLLVLQLVTLVSVEPDNW